MDETTHHRICPLCEACCGLEIRTRGREIVSIRGAADDVFSHGYICPKGYALKDLHEDPDRLRTPLIKRDGRFVEATWDEAFAEIERRLPPLLEKHGRDAVALSIGNPSAHKMGLLLYVPRLGKALGTKNVYSASTLDQMPKQLSAGLMFGHWLSIPLPDIERADFLLMLGANPVASNGSLWTVPDFRGKAKALRARGGRLVVVDPRRTETAAIADAHHAIRPGADVFLLAAMVHTLFDEGLVNTGRLTPHLNGIDVVRAAVQPFAPERVAARCALDAGVIRSLARELAAAPRGCVYGRIGTCTQPYGTLCSWLVDVLNALTAKLDEPGGAMLPQAPAFQNNSSGEPGRGRGIVTGRWASRVSGAPEVFGELPMTCLAEEIETPGEGQVKALITLASNPVLSSPGGPRLAAALDTLDFMVSVDIYVNETTRHADVILPGSSPLEDSHYDVAFHQLSHRNHARWSAPVFERDPAHVPEWQILLRLAAIAQGRGAGPVAGESPEQLLDAALRTGPYGLTLAQLQAAPGGIDLGPLQPRLPAALRTPSGQVELAPAACIGDLPRALADLDTPPAPLVVIGRRDVRSNNSWMHNLPVLAKGPARCTLLVHPQDAARAGVASGTTARLAGAGRSVTVTVEVDDSVAPGVVCLPHGWGHDRPGARLTLAAERPGASLNDILDDTLRDPLSGNAVLAGGAVTLEAVEGVA